MQLTAVSMAHNAENVLLVLHLPLRDFAQCARSEKRRTKEKKHVEPTKNLWV
jgi:hypothetical protein